MKIRINKDIVEFTPEHAAEAAELEALWVKMGNYLPHRGSEPCGEERDPRHPRAV